MICDLFEISDIFYVSSNNSLLLFVDPDTAKDLDIGKLLKFKPFKCHWHRSRILLIEYDLKTPSAIVYLHHYSHLFIKFAYGSTNYNNFSHTLTILKFQIILRANRTILEKFECDRSEYLLSPCDLFPRLIIISTKVAIAISTTIVATVIPAILRIEKPRVAFSELYTFK